MRAGVFQGVGDIAVLEVGDPTCGETDVVIEVASCGVCGTDRSIFRGEYEVAPPMILGHEYVGTVVEVGRSVTRLAIGDRAVVDPNVVDGICFFCQRGQSHLCSGLSPLGVGRPGGFAQWSLVPQTYAYPIPDQVPFSDAVLTEPLACCIRGIDQAKVTVGDVVVVLGAGPIGGLLMQLSRLSGAAFIICVEPAPGRHELARRAGADVVCLPGDASGALREIRGTVGADVVVEASGTLAGAQSTFSLVRRGGTILLFGVYPQGGDVALSPFHVNEDELRVVGSLNNPNTHSRALELMASGRLELRGVISHHLPLDDIAFAMDLDNFDRPGKVVIDLLAS